MTAAEVLAEYLGVTPDTWPEFYLLWDDRDCFVCKHCDSPADRHAAKPILRMPDPLNPGPAGDVWLGVLARWEGFWCLHGFVSDFGAEVFHDGFRGSFSGKENDPTPAIVRAMMAADPAFAEKMEGATP